jgi:type II secretory pathway pseudopilin PulG
MTATVPDVPDRGDTLVEVLLAVVIMGTLVVAIIEGYLTAAQNQRRHHDLSQAETLTRTYIEGLQQHPGDFSSCGANYAASPPSAGMTVQVANVGYWVKNSDSPAQFVSGCGGGGGGVPDIQKLTVTVTRGSSTVMSTEIVLRTSP